MNGVTDNRSITGTKQVTIRVGKQVRIAQREMLDANVLQPFEIGARLQALVSHPDRSPEFRRAIASAICSDIIAQRIEQDPGSAEAFRFRFPQYAKNKNRKSLGSQAKRWEKGLLAGVIFLRQMKAAAGRDGGEPADDEVSLPLQAIAEFMWPEQRDEENYDWRIHDALRDDVRRYHPVAHLVAAFQFAARCADEEGLRMEFDYDDLDFHRAIVGMASKLAKYIRDTPELARAAERLIEIEWRG